MKHICSDPHFTIRVTLFQNRRSLVFFYDYVGIDPAILCNRLGISFCYSEDLSYWVQERG